MSVELIGQLALVMVLGIGSQWLAWRLGLPSIVLLLGVGILAGPVADVIDPNELFGELLTPIVSLATGLILYEGGLTLNARELRGGRRVLVALVTIGALITWVVATLGAHYILGLPTGLALLLGAILIVSGPTVVGPMLQHIRPTARLRAILKSEDILIDPVGTTLAILMFHAIATHSFDELSFVPEALLTMLWTLLVGGAVGLAVAATLVIVLRRRLAPDLLVNPISLALVLGGFALANALQEEAGLFAATVAGIALANQSFVSVRRLVEFKENLSVLIVSGLFILLAAGLERDQVRHMLTLESLLFLLVLILLARPLAVFVSSLGTPLEWRERAFLAWMCPRGIVTAAVASTIGLELSRHEVEGAAELIPYSFVVIIGTCLVYGLSGRIVGRALGVATPNPQGVLILGAYRLGRELASAIQQLGFDVLLVDTNRANLQEARMAGLPTYYGNILAEEAIAEMDLEALGKLLALTPNESVNALAALHLGEIFETSDVYQLAPNLEYGEEGATLPADQLTGRFLGGSKVTFELLEERLASGATLKATQLTDTFNYVAFQDHYNGSALPLLAKTPTGDLLIFGSDEPREPEPGDLLVALVDEPADGGTQQRNR